MSVVALPVLALAVTLVPVAAQDLPAVRARLMSIESDSVSLMVGGIVLDRVTREPLAGAQVFIGGTAIGTLTDGRGRFRLDMPEAGTEPMRIRLIPYGEVCVSVPFRRNVMQSLVIELSNGVVFRDDDLDPRTPPARIEPIDTCVEPENVPAADPAAGGSAPSSTPHLE